MQQSMHQARQGLLAEKRLEIAASDVEAKHFFAALVDDSPYSVAVHPDVEGTITLNLQDVTLEETIDVVKELYGYDIRTRGNVIQVYPAGMRTETFPLDYLFVKRFGLSSTSINSGGVSENDPNSGNNNNNNNNNNNSNSSSGRSSNNGNNSNNGYGSGSDNSSSGINIYTENESDFWTELKETLLTLVGDEDGRSVIVSPQAGLVTVRAYPEEIKAVKRFIDDSESHLRRQVIIEAKILEVTLSDDYQQGVKWDNIFGHIGSTDLSFSTTGNVVGNVISGAIGGTTSIGIDNADFSGVIELLQTQGNVQVDIAFSEPLPTDARPDLSVEADIQVAKLENTLFVSRPLFSQSQTATSFYKLDPDGGLARRVKVEVGQGSTSHIQIINGLEEGDTIISSDPSRFDSYPTFSIN